jgi:hypothetical protein
MKQVFYSIINPSCNIYLEPNIHSEMVSEVLFGEQLEVVKRIHKWIYIKLNLDHYSGWIEEQNLIEYVKPTHRVITQKTIIKKEPDIKSNSISYISMGSFVKVLSIQKKWAKFLLPKDNVGYIPKNHIKPLDLKENNWIEKSILMLGIPYLWGGRGLVGIDCSGLIQVTFQASGLEIPRDTKDQVIFAEKNFMKKEKISKNCILFWNGHVAFANNEDSIIHASASAMSVICEPVLGSITKIEKITNSQTNIFKIPKY